MALKPLPRLVLIVGAVGAAWYGVDRYVVSRPAGLATAVPTTTLQRIDVPVAAAGATTLSPTAAPTTTTTTTSATPIPVAAGPAPSYTARMLLLPWNAEAGLAYANGGATTARGSLMAGHGVGLALERQDDYAQMVAEQALFAGEVASGVEFPTKGAAFVVIMGDALPGYAASARAAMEKTGQRIAVVGALGYSRGEDKCMLPAEVATQPQKARGSLIGAVLRDGDWNICIKYASDNAIPVNPDPTTYDPDAMNFVSVGAFTEADEKLIAASHGACETRPVVHAGQPTGERRRVCQNGTATWTPGDVKVAREVGGLAAVASTREYLWQMPAVIIGNQQWMSRHPAYVQHLLAAAFEGSDAVKASDAGLLEASRVMAAVTKEQSAEWWAKYHRGVVEKDAKGLDIRLGGSTTSNLADNLYLFGLNGNDNLYRRVYTVYGDIARRLYPQEMPQVPAYESVVDTQFVQALAAGAPAAAAVRPDTPAFQANAPVASTFARRAWSIEFDTGKASFRPEAMPVLEQLADQVSVSGLAVQVTGHTDNVGDPAANLALSRRRAEAVSQWLQANASSSFPAERLRVRAYGDQQPVASNASADGRARNRRVEIALVRTE